MSSHRHIKSEKRRIIVKKAVELGVIREDSRLISMAKLPLLHAFTQEALRIELSDHTLSRLLKDHVSRFGGGGESLADSVRPMKTHGSFPTYTMATGTMAMPLQI